MRIALIADIHGSATALETALRRWRKRTNTADDGDHKDGK
jgi:hypothetical protein